MAILMQSRWRCRGYCIGTFAQATTEQEEEVPPPSDFSTSPEPSAIEKHNGGYGIALYCGYFGGPCHNDASERRRRCSLCQVKCCTEACIRNHPNNKSVCRHCTQAWNITEQQGGFNIRRRSRHNNEERFRSRSRDDSRSLAHQPSASTVVARGSIRRHQLQHQLQRDEVAYRPGTQRRRLRPHET